MNTNFLKTLLFITAIILFASCDKDLNNVGGDIIGDEHYGFIQDLSTTVTAYTKTTGVIDTKNLDVNPLGIYDNPNTTFGKTTASFVTQVQLATVNPTLATNLTRNIQSVVLYVPYFTKSVTTNTDGSHTYVLDSIVNKGENLKKIKLSVFENGYDMNGNDFDTNFLEAKRFYSNQNSTFNSYKIGTRLNDGTLLAGAAIPVTENDEFVFSSNEYTDSSSGTLVYIAPGMRINLNLAYFQNKILNASSDKLVTNAAFMDYFKGLYFKVEQSGTDKGTMAMLNFKKGTIIIKYKEQNVAGGSDTDKSITLNLNGNTASLLDNNYNPPLATDKLYLKGGEGSVAYINLFGTKNPTTGKFQELEDLKNKKYLINEANLVFYIDNSTLGTAAIEPNRLFLYDARNKRPVVDYFYDSSTSLYANSSKVVHDGLIFPKQTATSTARGIKYKVRITDHIRNLINKDSTNVTLGLAVCQAIGNQFFNRQKTLPTTYPTWMATYPYNERNELFYPSSSVMNPLGTILYGTDNSVPANQKVKLEIWYTKPD